FPAPVSALTASGGVDAGYTATVHFTSTDAQAGLPADYTFTAADAGTHTFTVTLKTAGSRAVTATAGGVTGTSGGVSVSPAAATHFSVGAPSGATAGVGFGVTLTAQDLYGNTATG